MKLLSELGKPVVRCKVKHNYPTARKASEGDANGLKAEILLVEGAKVMVTRNLWTAKGVYQNIKASMGLANSNSHSGLVNGSQGVVKKIWYAPGAGPKIDLPSVVFVECKGYKGETNSSGQLRFKLNVFLGPPYCGLGWDTENIQPSWVPIPPVTAWWQD